MNDHQIEPPWIRFSVSVDLVITIEGDEATARHRLREMMDWMCDGIDLPEEEFNNEQHFGIAMGRTSKAIEMPFEARIYGNLETVEQAEVMDQNDD